MTSVEVKLRGHSSALDDVKILAFAKVGQCMDISLKYDFRVVMRKCGESPL